MEEGGHPHTDPKERLSAGGGGGGRPRQQPTSGKVVFPLFPRNSHPPTQNALNPGLPRPYILCIQTQMMPMPCMPMSDPTHPVPRWPPTGWQRRPRPSPPRRKRPRRRRPRRPRRPRRRTARSGGPRRRTRSWCGQRSPRSRTRGHCFPQRSRSRHFTVFFSARHLFPLPHFSFNWRKFRCFLFFSSPFAFPSFFA